jgi:hypothetical protein
VFAVLTALAMVGVAGVQPPSPLPASAPGGVFSAGRAFVHVERIGAQVHVVGSPAADEVRDYLMQTLTGYGLSPEIQDTAGLHTSRYRDGGMAHVRNIVTVLPGTAPTGRVLLVAHYDSAPTSLGASDDGAGVAALLEVARAMTSGTRPRYDLVFLLTDSEETGLAGAEAFVAQHPLGRDRAVVYNLEARGSSGPAIMFQTSPGNAALVDLFSRVPRPVATSLAVEVYRRLPNDTDFSVFLAQGRFTGLNTAYIDGSFTYHSPLDRPSTMDKASLQHHGDSALAVARELGRADLAPLTKPSSHDLTYFPFAGSLVRYPSGLVWPLAVLALLAVAVLAFLARRRGLTSWPRTAVAVGLALVPLICAAVAAQLLWLLLTTIRPGYRVLLDPTRPFWFRLALVALSAAILLGWYALARRRVGPVPLAIGALGLLAVLGLVLAGSLPGAAYLLTLPALVGAVAGIAAVLVRQALARVAILAAGSAVAVLIWAPTIALFLPALGLQTGAAAASFAVALGLSLVPVLELLWRPSDKSRQRFLGSAPAALAASLALTLIGIGLGVDRWDANHPRPAHLMYVLDKDTGGAQWVSVDASATWTSRYVRDREKLGDAFPVLPAGELAVGPAQAADLPAPEVAVLADSTSGGERTLRLRFTSRRPVRFIAFYGEVGNHRVERATVEGRDAPVYIDKANRFGVQFHGPPAAGIEATLVVTGTGPLKLRIIDGSDGLDNLPGFVPRPPDVGVLGLYHSELLAVARTATV